MLIFQLLLVSRPCVLQRYTHKVRHSCGGSHEALETKLVLRERQIELHPGSEQKWPALGLCGSPERGSGGFQETTWLVPLGYSSSYQPRLDDKTAQELVVWTLIENGIVIGDPEQWAMLAILLASFTCGLFGMKTGSTNQRERERVVLYLGVTALVGWRHMSKCSLFLPLCKSCGCTQLTVWHVYKIRLCCHARFSSRVKLSS